MTRLVVDAARRLLLTPYGCVPCALGRGGIVAAAEKREGDGCTPIGEWLVRGALFRRDRAAPPPGFALPWRWIAADDGWSDDPADPSYNRPVRHPHRHSAERLWRDDGCYDVVLTLGYNDRRPQPNRGSAIFLHCTGAGDTEGCVAIDRTDLDLLLPHVAALTTLLITMDSRIESQAQSSPGTAVPK